MQWVSPPKNPKDGDSVVIKKFLWTPLQIGPDVKWLQYAKIKYVCAYTSKTNALGYAKFQWIPQEFVD